MIFKFFLLLYLWFFIYFWKNPCELTNDKRNTFNIDFPLDLNKGNITLLDENHKKIHIGKRKGYHATSRDSAQKIMKYKILIKGEHGMFGPGIYFAFIPKIAHQKVLHVNHKSDTIVECFVDFGDSLILEEPNHDLTLKEIHKYGCHSVLGRSQEGHKWEFVVYESSRAEPIKIFSFSS